jgi:hypothetical protein
MQTKTLASLKHAHIGPALAMIALAVAALGLSACGRVVPKPPKAAKATQAPAEPATIDLSLKKALRSAGDQLCYELTAKWEKKENQDVVEAVKYQDLCINGTETDGLYDVAVLTNLPGTTPNANMQVVLVPEEEAKPATKLIDESSMAASAEKPKDEGKKEEIKPDHKERLAIAIVTPADAEKKTPAKVEWEKDKVTGKPTNIVIEFTGSLKEDASKRKRETGTVIIQGKKYKYSRSNI